MATLREGLWEDLVIAILSVNQYSLEKTYSAIGGLRAEGIMNPENLASLGPEGIAERLRRAGCDRGEYMTRLFAERLWLLGQFAVAREVKNCEDILDSGDPPSIERLLLPVKGIGPRVLANFFLLRGIESNRTPS